MEKIFGILISVAIVLGGSKHLSTDSCGLDVTAFDTQTKTVHFSACLAFSGDITKYTITQQGDKLFVELYGRWPTVFSKFDGEFDYKLPDDVNEIYLRGKNPEDIRLIWRRT